MEGGPGLHSHLPLHVLQSSSLCHAVGPSKQTPMIILLTSVHYLAAAAMLFVPSMLAHSLDTRARAYGDNLAENPRYAEKGKHYYDGHVAYKVAKVGASWSACCCCCIALVFQAVRGLRGVSFRGLPWPWGPNH